MSWSVVVIGFIILVALVFDYINGFHDAANSIATVVSTRVLTPMQAVAWAAFFNFVAAFGFGVEVAQTVGKGVVDAGVVDQWVILGGLIGAIAWNLITWYFGIPSSSSHALIGGFAGAAVAKAGFESLLPTGLLKILTFIVLAPVLGLCLGFTLMTGTLWAVRRVRPSRVDGLFRRLQLLSAACYSLGHGTNDAQKTMGIISILLFSAGYLGSEFYVPFWVILAAHAALGLGTLAGGWRIVRTMGMRLTKLRPVGGFCAETAGSWGWAPLSASPRCAGESRVRSSGHGSSPYRSPPSWPPRPGRSRPCSSPGWDEGGPLARRRAGRVPGGSGRRPDRVGPCPPAGPARPRGWPAAR
jgi:PiT family inorganic phosphate transporter